MTTAAQGAEPVDFSDAEAAVEAGRQALSEEYSTPWYAEKADAYRPLNLPPRRPRTRWTGDWGLLVEVLKFLLWLLVAAAVVAIVVALLRGWRRGEPPADDDTAAAGDRIARVEALPVAIEQRVADLLAEARGRAAAGDYAMAIVYLFSHLLVEADRADALHLVKGKTNRQYLRELRRNRPHQPELAATLERATVLFEQAFFGARAPTEPQFDACLGDAQRFDALLRAATGEPA